MHDTRRGDAATYTAHADVLAPRRVPDAERGRGGRGSIELVATAEGRHWIFAVAPNNRSFRDGDRVALVGPLPMPRRQPFVLSAALAVLPPGASSMVHTHSGPEAWYLLAGEQCLETSAGVARAGQGRTMIQRGYTPMQLNVTGKETRRALFVVVHDSATTFSAPSTWKPAGRCAGPAAGSRR